MNGRISALLQCICIAAVVVLSLYTEKSARQAVFEALKTKLRDKPTICYSAESTLSIRRRACALLTCAAAGCVMILVHRGIPGAEVLRRQPRHVLSAAVATLTLFAGPLLDNVLESGIWNFLKGLHPKGLLQLHALRNFIVCPVAEETVYRGLMWSILRPHWGVGAASLIASALFSVSHCHHIVLRASRSRREGHSQKDAWTWAAVNTAAQAAITMVFGAYASALFVATRGSVPAVAVSHALCNAIGPPTLRGVCGRNFPLHRRLTSAAVYVAGVALFASWATRAVATAK